MPFVQKPRIAWLLVSLLSACASGSGGDDGGHSTFDAAMRDAHAVDSPMSVDAARDGGTEERTCLAAELCTNGLDDDCDSMVDDGCACASGEVAACFRGDPRHRTVGECRDGTMLCEGSAEFGVWGACEGDAIESSEVCDAAGLDEDCDGAANDGCECVDGDPEVPCGSDTGACMPGVQRCVGGVRTDCEGVTGPEVETCNAIDDDCDGAVDDGLVRPCGITEGVCRGGIERCEDGAWLACEGGAGPEDEVCDNLDNDCDAVADEDISRPCGSDTGRCVAGIERCASGEFDACEGRIDPIAETCNNSDDDCDGPIDEDLSRPCGTDVGRCVSGTEICAAGVYGACTGAIDPIAERCDGIEDDDCDGAVDDGCGCTSGSTRTCGTDVGRCASGSQTCNAAGTWGPCIGAIDPRAETCDGTDDDCDGTSDEGCDCVTGATRTCGTSTGECSTGTEACDASGAWGPCLGSVGPSSEVCNGRDDDCDTLIDDGDVCPRFPPTATCPGATSTTVGTSVALSGSGSDPDGGTVTYEWTVVTRPVGSTSLPAPSGSASTSFTPDAAGAYTLRFCVVDDEAQRTCCTVAIDAMSSCTPPTAPSITTCGTSWDRRPIIEFAPLPAGVTYELFLDGAAAPYATVTMAGQNYHRPAIAVDAGGPPPGAERMIHARACRVADPSCCAISAAVRVRLIEACTTAIAPSASNIVFSEYVVNGDGACPAASCEAGEAIEITNLSHCPVTLDGHHFGYCNPASCGAHRWMNFGAADVIPPRGVYVAIRNRVASACTYPFFGPDDPGLFGLRISLLSMMGDSLASGWFNNSGGGMSTMRVASGAWSSITDGSTLEIISPYSGAADDCESIGFDAIDECGDISGLSTPTEVLTPNQLGRLWHPCDAVVAPSPASCR